MSQTKSATIQLSLNQIAYLLRQLSYKEISALEELLNKTTNHEIIKRSKDNLKKGFSHDQMLEIFA